MSSQLRAPTLFNASGDPLELGHSPSQGVGGTTYPIDTPSIAVVSPVTNPPGFDIGLPTGNVTTSRNVAVGDKVQIQFDGAGTIYESAALTSGDLIAGTITITGIPTLSAGDHTGQTRIHRPTGDLYSAWVVSSAFTAPAAGSTRFDSTTAKFDSTLLTFDKAA